MNYNINVMRKQAKYGRLLVKTSPNVGLYLFWAEGWSYSYEYCFKKDLCGLTQLQLPPGKPDDAP